MKSWDIETSPIETSMFQQLSPITVMSVLNQYTGMGLTVPPKYSGKVIREVTPLSPTFYSAPVLLPLVVVQP